MRVESAACAFRSDFSGVILRHATLALALAGARVSSELVWGEGRLRGGTMTAPKPRRVVVVGRSFAGARVERALRQEEALVDVTVIDVNAFFEYTPGILRCFVEPASYERLAVPFHGDVVVDRVIEVVVGSTKRVETASGLKIEYDVLVLATGSTYPGELIKQAAGGETVESRRRAFADEFGKIERAETIAIVGSGPVGVELAAEIVGKYGIGKKVTMFSRSARILPQMEPKASAYALSWLERSGNFDLVVEEEEASEGALESFDLVYRCFGSAANVNFRFPFRLSDSGAIRCRKTMQSTDDDAIFALGDCAELEEDSDKTAFAADAQAVVVAKNILALVRGEEEAMVEFPGDVCFGSDRFPLVMCTSLYKSSGILQQNSLVLHGRLGALAKRIIEGFQLRIARSAGRTVETTLWEMCEKVTLFVCCKILPRPSVNHHHK